MQPAARKEKKSRVLAPRAPAPQYKGLCNLLPVVIFNNLCRSEYISINEVNKKRQVIASELTNDHPKDDEDKSRTDFFVVCLMFSLF